MAENLTHDIEIIINGIDSLIGNACYETEADKGELIKMREKANEMHYWLLEKPPETENYDAVHDWMESTQSFVTDAKASAESLMNSCPNV